MSVVFLHSRFGDIANGNTDMDSMVKLIYNLCYIFASVAVPLFFITSGFLFFKEYEHKIQFYFEKIKTRFKTLMIPYLFWNVSLLLLTLFLQSIPALKSFINKPIIDYSFFNIINLIFSINSLTPISYQFWYIKDLMIMVVLSPVIFFGIRHIPYIGLLIVFLPWFFGLEPGIIHVRYSALLFFYSGALLSVSFKYQLNRIDNHRGKIIFSYTLMALIEALLRTSGYSLYNHQIHQAIIILGIPAFWGATGIFLNSPANKILLNVARFSFFVFATHEPIMTIFRKIFYLFMPPRNSLQELAYYISLPGLTVVVTVLTAILLNKLSPKFFGIITGQRLSHRIY